MEDSTISIIGIIIASILMFIVPLVLIADRSDDISHLTVQTLTAQFVDNIIKHGKITNEDYGKYISSLSSTGNTYDIEIEIKILDENTAQRETNNDPNAGIGQNSYYSIYTSQIEEKLAETQPDLSNPTNSLNKTGQLILKEGDVISVTAKNSSKTLSQTLKSIYYNIKGEDLHIIAGASTGTIAVNGAI